MARGGKGSGSGSLVKGLAPGSDIAFQPDLSAAIAKARAINGQFLPGGPYFHTLLTAAHRKMAEKAQGLIVEALEESIRNREGGERPQRGTNYLINALKDPKTIDYNIDGFVVGTTSLDDSPARSYYRNLEEGTSTFVGRLVLATFTDAAYGNRTGPYPNNERLDARMVQFPLSYAGRAGRSSEGPFLFRIKHPIEPRYYFRKGIKRFVDSGFTKTTYLEVKEALAHIQ